MRDDQLFGLIAMVALLVWLGRAYVPEPRRRQAEIAALGLVAVGIALALIRSAIWFAG
ncbi:hypothetical protein [Benzoatithermus flavus]|jgi:hypothetical protein|uniref:PEP-CTERM protein-sorting domain-containing protein n=1 Tax=Benzoatithermus flavus TaxID=3108223 RepID=A0ABU8XN81_9PROT